MGDLPWVWGATPDEVAHRWPCDVLQPDPAVRLLRAVDVAAPPELVDAWLGNLRLAPYSYDLLDNLGRRSPRRLATHLPPLGVGDRVAGVFDVVEVAPGRGLTAATPPGSGAERAFGRVTMTYAVEPGRTATRLLGVVRQGGRHGGGRGGGPGVVERSRSLALAWGDLVMMRRQLHTLRDLAERDARDPRARDGGDARDAGAGG
ncbi:SRPBCC family protein [Oryzobacter terrae]|uniref:SRPBCC family protein n=1 Tax=Oryzobacter terrae TaxID=1620385 RepID=UPI00366CD5F6